MILCFTFHAFAGPTTRPVVQLTAQLPRNLAKNTCVSDPTLRELHRQAVLIGAREQMGLRTRDMALDEPFAVEGATGVSTILIESRIRRGGKAEVGLSRSTAPPTTRPYDLADKPVDGAGTEHVWWDSFPTPGADLTDYPAFVSECERRSRGQYVDGLREQHVVDPADEHPIPWVNDGPVSSDADRRLGRFDVFDQYVAVRLTHEQSSAQGASFDRTAALSRGYANLGRLTGRQWSFASKAFLARSLLYAERLVAHESGSPRSLYVRAYARAVAGLHSAAVDDLTVADKSGGPRPPFAAVAAAVATYDLVGIESAMDDGSHALRGAAAGFSNDIAADFGTTDSSALVARVTATHPELLDAAIQSDWEANGGPVQMTTTSRLGAVPVLIRDALLDAPLPVETKLAVTKLSAHNDGVRSVNDLFKSLTRATESDPAEPSFGVLAGLIGSQEFLAMVDRIQADVPAVAGQEQNRIESFFGTAQAIVDAQPFGPLVMLCSRIGATEPANHDRYKRATADLKKRHAGPWCFLVNSYLYLQDDDQRTYTNKWVDNGYRLTDATALDLTDFATASYKRGDLSDEDFVAKLRRTSPHSGRLMRAWMAAVPPDRIQHDRSLYDGAMADVDAHFLDRPDVAAAAADWSDARGDFARSFDLIKRADERNPSPDSAGRLARLAHHTGDAKSALAYVDKAILPGSTYYYGGEGDPELPQATPPICQKATWLCDAGHVAAAIEALQAVPAEQINPQVMVTLARCDELNNQPDDAAAAYRAAAAINPLMVRKQCEFATRLGRADVEETKKAADAVCRNPQFATAELLFYLQLIDGDDHKAFVGFNRHNDGSFWSKADLVVLAAKYHHKDIVRQFLDLMRSTGNQPEFVRLFSDIATAKNPAAALTAYDQWQPRQLDDELNCSRESVIGRLLIATNHKEEGVRYLKAALSRPQRETDGYFLAWKAMRDLDAGK